MATADDGAAGMAASAGTGVMDSPMDGKGANAARSPIAADEKSGAEGRAARRHGATLTVQAPDSSRTKKSQTTPPAPSSGSSSSRPLLPRLARFVRDVLGPPSRESDGRNPGTPGFIATLSHKFHGNRQPTSPAVFAGSPGGGGGLSPAVKSTLSSPMGSPGPASGPTTPLGTPNDAHRSTTICPDCGERLYLDDQQQVPAPEQTDADFPQTPLPSEDEDGDAVQAPATTSASGLVLSAIATLASDPAAQGVAQLMDASRDATMMMMLDSTADITEREPQSDAEFPMYEPAAAEEEPELLRSSADGRHLAPLLAAMSVSDTPTNTQTIDVMNFANAATQSVTVTATVDSGTVPCSRDLPMELVFPHAVARVFEHHADSPQVAGNRDEHELKPMVVAEQEQPLSDVVHEDYFASPGSPDDAWVLVDNEQ